MNFLVIAALAMQAIPSDPASISIEAGTAAYWAGCQGADRATLDEYWRDFATVATPAEAEAWFSTDTLPDARRAAAACQGLRAGWTRRAARVGTSVAARIALHYERLERARARYSLVGERIRLGPRTRLLSAQVGRPDDVGLDDRGLIYVRLGEPDRTATFAGAPGPLRRLPAVEPGNSRDAAWLSALQGFQVSAECYHPNESWAYDYPDGTRVYHFSPLDGAANWWLIENLADVYRCGDPTSAVTVTNDVPVATATLGPGTGQRHAPVSRAAWLVLGDVYMSRSGLDPTYGVLAQRIFQSGPDDMRELDGMLSASPDALSLQGELENERQGNFELARLALASIPDRPAVLSKLPLLFETLQFRRMAENVPELTRVWLNAVVEGNGIRGVPREEGGFRYGVVADFTLVGDDGELRRTAAQFSAMTSEELRSGAGVPVRLMLDIPPGDYEYSVVVKDANDERDRPTGNWRTDSLTVRAYGTSLPQLSDVAFAPDSGGSWSPVPGAALPISPVHRTNSSRQAWLYFEAYGLSPTGDYSVEVHLDPAGDGDPFSLTFRGATPESRTESVRRLLRLDLEDTTVMVGTVVELSSLVPR